MSVASTNATTKSVALSKDSNETEQKPDNDDEIFKKSLWMWEKLDFD